MPNCKRCGTSKDYFSVPYTCVVCGTYGCKNCLIYVATLELRDNQNNIESEKVWVCSKTCYQKFRKDFGTEEKEVLIDLKKLLGVLKCK